MNFDCSNFASYDDKPPYFNKKMDEYFDNGQGIPNLSKEDVTLDTIKKNPFLFLQDHDKKYKNIIKKSLNNVEIDNELGKIFFSENNMKRIQKQIKNEVFKRTKGKFKLEVDQEPKDLYIIMTEIYLEKGYYLPNQIIRQVKKLNSKVIDILLPDMITEIKKEYGYLQDINKPLQPIPRPMNFNKAGRKTLSSITTIWDS
ncbi:Hypothetical protein KVN_LOCUS361 [uncultured virus]|nr:Hypothetical protein KVN_LOCUS361 [uncultured virus]